MVRWIGAPLPMIDGRERVTGRIPYVLNLTLPGMLHAKILRSEVPHAHLHRVDVSRARALSGVVAVLTRDDLGPDSGYNPIVGKDDRTPVAVDRVRYIGEPIAAVAAVDLETAEEALSLIDVEYEELPAVFDAHEALKPGAPVIHPGLDDLLAGPIDGWIRPDPTRNLCHHFRLEGGDVDRAFAEADYVFEDVYSSPPAQQMTFEPQVAIAQVEDGRVTLWAATQIPSLVRTMTARLFRLPEDQVRVIVPTLGGGYGAKTEFLVEPIAALLAAKAGGRPVKLAQTREEEFATVIKHPTTVRIKTGVRRDGTLLARETESYWNAGAYMEFSAYVGRNASAGSVGPYRIPNVRINASIVYTNLPSSGAFRGLGVSQMAWASEQQMDKIARKLGIDPLELRLKNLLVDGDALLTDEVMHDVHWREIVEAACKGVGWNEPLPVDPTGVKKYGRGCAVTWKIMLTPAKTEAKLRLEADGTVSVLTSFVEMGQGLSTAFCQIAADAVGVPIERVRIVKPDTDITPYDARTASSRSAHSGWVAIGYALDDAKQKLIDLAADVLEANPADLAFEQGRVYVQGSPERGLSFEEVLRRTQQPYVEGFGDYSTKGGIDPETGKGVLTTQWHQGAGAAEVEVDTETGRVRVLRYHGTSFAGKVVNPRLADLQNVGNVVFGYGPAIFEEIVFDQGQVTNPNLSDYMIASILDVPEKLTGEAIENPAIGEIQGIGENTIPPVAPAIGNAITAATGVEIHDLPMTPERVLRALERQRTPAPPLEDMVSS